MGTGGTECLSDGLALLWLSRLSITTTSPQGRQQNAFGISTENIAAACHGGVSRPGRAISSMSKHPHDDMVLLPITVSSIVLDLRPKASMNGQSKCYDNSMVETFFKSLKTELIWRNRWDARRQTEDAIFWYNNGFYVRPTLIPERQNPSAFERKVA